MYSLHVSSRDDRVGIMTLCILKSKTVKSVMCTIFQSNRFISCFFDTSGQLSSCWITGIPSLTSRPLSIVQTEICIFFTDEVACVDPEICQQSCDNPIGCSNIAYPKLVLELLPKG